MSEKLCNIHNPAQGGGVRLTGSLGAWTQNANQYGYDSSSSIQYATGTFTKLKITNLVKIRGTFQMFYTTDISGNVEVSENTEYDISGSSQVNLYIKATNLTASWPNSEIHYELY